MSGRTGGALPRSVGRRRQSLAVGLSIVLHSLLLAIFALRQSPAPPAIEAPVMAVELVLRAPSPGSPASPPATPRPKAAPPDARAAQTSTAPAEGPPGVAGAGVDPRWTVDLNKPVFADGQWPRPERPLLARCDPLKDPKRESRACRREDDVANAVSRSFDPQKSNGEFAREGRHSEATKRYRELPGDAGYPGIACHVFHRC